QEIAAYQCRRRQACEGKMRRGEFEVARRDVNSSVDRATPGDLHRVHAVADTDLEHPAVHHAPEREYPRDERRLVAVAVRAQIGEILCTAGRSPRAKAAHRHAAPESDGRIVSWWHCARNAH